MQFVARRTVQRIGLGMGASSVGLALCSPPSNFPRPAAACEGGAKVPPFSMSTTRYDQSTYMGRLQGILEQIDPRTLLTTDAEIKRCQGLLEEFQKTNALPAGVSDEDMWKARNLVEGIIHPVTKEPMFALGRMSAFVPANVPLCALMLNANSTGMVIFAQWLNQSYNVLNNYVNRSSLEVSWSGLLQPYCLAVAVSCSIALLGRKASAALPKLGLFVPYLAVISAGSCNVAFTRMDEWSGRGILITSPEGKELGMSLKAGQEAVLKTVLTRSCCLPIPVLLVPPVVMSMLPITGAAAIAAEIGVIVCCLSVALPAALAILPQAMEISVASLEPEYQGLKDSKGNPITSVIANKGL